MSRMDMIQIESLESEIEELEATIKELQEENKRLRKIIALSENDNDSERKWVKPKPKFWKRTNG